MVVSSEDLRFLHYCDKVRGASPDPHRKVGAVIVDKMGQVLAAGVNAPPAALRLTPEQTQSAIRQDASWKYFVLEHAERNAIFEAYRRGTSLVGATMYATLFPCSDCARAIAAAGISRLVVVGLPLDPVRDQKWREHYEYARHILQLAGVTVEVADPATIEDRPGHTPGE